MCREDHLVQPSPRFLFLSLALSSLSFLSACSLALDFSKFREGCPEGEEMVNGTCEPIPDVIAELLEQSRFDEAEQTEFTPPAAGESLVFTGLIGEAPYKESTFTFRARAGQWLTIEAFARDQLVPKFRVRRVGDSGKWRESPVDPSMRKSERKLLILHDGDYELHLSPSHWHAEGEGGRFIVRMTQLVPPAPQPYEAHEGDLLALDENFFVFDHQEIESVHQALVQRLGAGADAALIAWHEGFSEVQVLPLTLGEPVQLAPTEARTYLLIDYFEAAIDQTHYALRDLEIFCDSEASPFGGGEGSYEAPFRICTPGHLNAVQTQLGAHHLLTRHLDMEGIEFFPLGRDATDGFTGSFDGGGHSIAHLKSPNPTDTRVGLFALINQNAIVKNLVLRAPNFFGEDGVGAIAGVNLGTISRVGVIGGIIGGTMANIGGIVGALAGAGMIKETFYLGRVSGDSNVGGIAGITEGGGSASISDSYAVLSASSTGGAAQHGAGIVGNLQTNQGKVSRSYALPSQDFERTGSFHPIAANVGGGEDAYRVDACYYLSGADYSETSHGVGLNAAHFGNAESFEGWDFTGIWFIDADAESFARPRLQFELGLKR